MEKEIKHHEQQHRDERKDDNFSSETSPLGTDFSDENNRQNFPVKRKRERIRAYRKIDYWQ